MYQHEAGMRECIDYASTYVKFLDICVQYSVGGPTKTALVRCLETCSNVTDTNTSRWDVPTVHGRVWVWPKSLTKTSRPTKDHHMMHWRHIELYVSSNVGVNNHEAASF